MLKCGRNGSQTIHIARTHTHNFSNDIPKCFHTFFTSKAEAWRDFFFRLNFFFYTTSQMHTDARLVFASGFANTLLSREKSR